MRLSTAIALLVLGAAASAAERDARTPLDEKPGALDLQVRWPGASNREAMVILEFDLPASGRPTNIRVAEGGFHEKRFTKAAINALEKSSWRPRRVNGIARDTTGLRQSFRFSINPAVPGVTPEFRAEADKVEEMLKSGDYKGGEFHAEWMLAEKVMLNYEYAVLEAELAFTYALLGKSTEALRKVARATERSGTRDDSFPQLLDAPPPNKASNYLLPKEVVVQLLALRMKLLAAQGLPIEAMQAYYELAGLGELPPEDPLVVLAARLAADIRGNGMLRARIEITDRGGWRQYLSRRSFTLEKVQGEINRMTIRCGENLKKLEYAPGEEWTVPEGWSQCMAAVGAEPGTKFEFVELPDTPAPAANQ